MSVSTEQRMAKLMLWVSPAFISSNYIIAKAASGEITPHLMALIRWSVALCLMLVVSRRSLNRLLGLSYSEYLQLLVLGGLGMWICGAFVY
jgi:drug/metabolite transporter (DMT)-like permease